MGDPKGLFNNPHGSLDGALVLSRNPGWLLRDAPAFYDDPSGSSRHPYELEGSPQGEKIFCHEIRIFPN